MIKKTTKNRYQEREGGEVLRGGVGGSGRIYATNKKKKKKLLFTDHRICRWKLNLVSNNLQYKFNIIIIIGVIVLFLQPLQPPMTATRILILFKCNCYGNIFLDRLRIRKRLVHLSFSCFSFLI